MSDEPASSTTTLHAQDPETTVAHANPNEQALRPVSNQVGTKGLSTGQRPHNEDEPASPSDTLRAQDALAADLEKADKANRPSERAVSWDSDELVVDWDGPDDPENPKNWSFRRKWAATAIVSAFTFISPVSSSMIAPASDKVAEQFGITNTVVMSMVTSIFVLAYAFGPLFLSPMSEVFGRSRVVQCSNLWYLVWNLACGFSRNTGEIIAFRFLAGLGGSAPLSIGGAVIGDVWRIEERGMALALYTLAPILGPVFGPIAGAWIASKSTWPWVFWSTTIATVLVQILGLFFLQETFAPVLLARKARKLNTNSEKRPVRTVFQSDDRHWQRIFAEALSRPFILFVQEPIVQLLGVYMAFVYGLLYIFLVTIPTIFQGSYHESLGIAGLHYIALGIGLSGASQLNARLMDRTYKYLMKKNNGARKPEYRLPAMVPASICLPIGLFLSGWAAQAHLHWAVVDLGTIFVGAGVILSFQSIQAYVIDAFALYAASALAAVNCFRALAGFGFPLFAPVMYKALGFGKGDSILAVAGMVIGCPAPWLLWTYGERIRNASKHAKK